MGGERSSGKPQSEEEGKGGREELLNYGEGKQGEVGGCICSYSSVVGRITVVRSLH